MLIQGVASMTQPWMYVCNSPSQNQVTILVDLCIFRKVILSHTYHSYTLTCLYCVAPIVSHSALFFQQRCYSTDCLYVQILNSSYHEQD